MTENKPINKDKIENSDQELLDKVKSLPKEKREIIMAKMEMYSGPIPHPEILKGYEELSPGSAKEIIENGIEESSHRRKLETSRQKRKGRLAWLSLIAFVILIFLFLLFSFYLILHDHKIIGSIFGGVSFISIFGPLINNVTELTKKDDISTSDSNGNKKRT